MSDVIHFSRRDALRTGAAAAAAGLILKVVS